MEKNKEMKLLELLKQENLEAEKTTISAQSLSPERVTYWRDDMYFPYALACLDSVLRHSIKAGHDYLEIVVLWNKPEYEDMLEKAEKLNLDIAADSDTWKDYVNLLLPNLIVLGEIYSTDEQTRLMVSRISEFIENHFNRENARTPKITRERSRFLGRVIIFRSLSDAKKLDPKLWEKWATDDLEDVMNTPKGKWPTTKGGRELREQTEKTLRGINFKLRHNDVINRWAEIWHLARVKPGNVNEALNKLAGGEYPDLVWGDSFRDDKYLREHIRPYDIATGRIQLLA